MSQISLAKGVKPASRWSWLALVLVLSVRLPMIHGQTASSFGAMVEGKLTVSLLDGSPQVIERSDISKLPHITVKVRSSGGKISIYSGVPLEALLKHMGAVIGKERRQMNLGSVVLVESVDQPSVLFAMAEFDVALTDKRILLADMKDGRPLTAPEGPFRIIVPDEKQPIRWAKQVWAIYVVQISEPPKHP